MSSPSATPLAVFARPPLAGHAKTRLAAALGDDGAARLYAAFVADVLAHAAAAGADVTLYVAGDPDEPSLLDIAGARAVRRCAQRGRDLGERMARALEAQRVLHGIGLVVGTDSPTLPLRDLTAAARALEQSDVVLGPAADGGFWLIGTRVPLARALDGVRWSSAYALADTLRGTARIGASVALAPPWYDVDTPDDLRLLRAHLDLDPSAAPATARALGF